MKINLNTIFEKAMPAKKIFPKIIGKCRVCGGDIAVKSSQLARRNKGFCSIPCAVSVRKKFPKKLDFSCAYCGGEIIVRNAGLLKPWRRFCSKSCAAANNNKHRIVSLETRRKIADAARKTFTGRKHSDEQRRKRAESLSGDKSHFWQGGKTEETRKLRSGVEYDIWRDKVYERDNYTCQICRARNGNGTTVYLNADHIKSWAKHPELRFDVSNGRTLCLPCHRQTPNFGFKAIAA
jgi:5-methylcytosine-specific restriction endonuclease McrA